MAEQTSKKGTTQRTIQTSTDLQSAKTEPTFKYHNQYFMLLPINQLNFSARIFVKEF